MKVTRTGKRRAAAINSIKVMLTSASLAAVLGGWVAISVANGSTLQVAQVDATATVQAFLDSRANTASTANTTAAASSAASSTTGTGSVTSSSAAAVAPTANAVPTRVFTTNIRTRSSR